MLKIVKYIYHIHSDSLWEWLLRTQPTLLYVLLAMFVFIAN